MTTPLAAGATNGDVPIWNSSTSSWVSTAKFDDYRGPAGFVRRDSGTQSIPNATDTQVTDYDYYEPVTPAFSMWNGSANGLLTVQKDGMYLVTANFYWAANATGYRDIMIMEGAPGAWEQRVKLRIPSPGNVAFPMSVSWVGASVVGDKYSMWVYQNSGSALNSYLTYKAAPRLSAIWLRVRGMYA